MLSPPRKQLGWALGKPLSLLFDPFESVTLFLAVLLAQSTMADARSNWLEGYLLMMVYVIIAVRPKNHTPTSKCIRADTSLYVSPTGFRYHSGITRAKRLPRPDFWSASRTYADLTVALISSQVYNNTYAYTRCLICTSSSRSNDCQPIRA